MIFSRTKTPYPLLSNSYANYVQQQYLQTNRIKKMGNTPRCSDSSFLSDANIFYVLPRHCKTRYPTELK